MISFSLLESWPIREACFWILTGRKEMDLGERQKLTQQSTSVDQPCASVLKSVRGKPPPWGEKCPLLTKTRDGGTPWGTVRVRDSLGESPRGWCNLNSQAPSTHLVITHLCVMSDSLVMNDIPGSSLIVHPLLCLPPPSSELWERVAWRYKSSGRSWTLDFYQRLANTYASTFSPQAHESHACVGMLRCQDHWMRQQSHR